MILRDTNLELQFGIAAMPPGRRQDILGRALDQRAPPIFECRMVPFSRSAADAYGERRARAQSAEGDQHGRWHIT